MRSGNEVWTIMKTEPCNGCGRMIIVHSVANLAVRCDPTPLGAQEVVRELGAGRQMWTPQDGRRLRAARPGDAELLREHRCTAAGALRSPSPVLGDPNRPKGRQAGTHSLAGPPTPSSAPRTAHSGARHAASPSSETRPRCSACGQPCTDGTYASVGVGELTVWAQHVETCGRTP